ncbi:MAG: hypothetical protein AAF768_11060 [Pseudomonadota bacterium]
MVTIVLLTLILGFYGWTKAGFGIVDAIYRSIMALGASDIYANPNQWCAVPEENSKCPIPDPNGQLALHVSRLTGLVFLFSAIFYATVKLLSETIARFRAEFRGRPLVAIGSSALANSAFLSSVASKKGRAWLGAHESLNEIRSVAVPWSETQDRASEILQVVKGAEHILVSGVDDASTMQYTAAILSGIEDRAGKPVSITSIFSSDAAREEASQLLDYEFKDPDSSARLLSYGRLAARAALKAHPPYLLARNLGQDSIHALIIGFGRVGQAVLRDIVVNARTVDFGIPYVTVIDPDGGQKQDWLNTSIPELDKVCHFKMIQGGLGGDHPSPASLPSDQPALTAIYICVGRASEALEALGALRIWLRSQKKSLVNVFVRVENAKLFTHESEEQTGLVHTFGTPEAVLQEASFLSGDPDRLAKRFHDKYEERAIKTAREKEEPYTPTPWEKLIEPKKASNRALIDHLPAKVFSAGLDLDTCRDEDGQLQLGCNLVLYEGEDARIELERLEHDRFVAERRMAGWVAGPTDTELRQNENLVDYEDLNDDIKAFDQSIIELTKEILRDG